MEFYALDDTSGTTYAVRASCDRFDVGAWAVEEAWKVAGIQEASNTFDVFRVDAAAVTAWATGDGEALPLGKSWTTVAERIGELMYEYPGEYVWRPRTPDHGTCDVPDEIAARLEYLRGEIRAERISYEEIAELQELGPRIPAEDVELREWAAMPEEQYADFGPVEDPDLARDIERGK